MSYYDYQASKVIDAEDYPFYALVMAAMRKADSDNARALCHAFPSTWSELQDRYAAPGGFLPGEAVPTTGGSAAPEA